MWAIGIGLVIGKTFRGMYAAGDVAPDPLKQALGGV